MKKDNYIYCDDLDEVCDWVNHNFEVVERRIKKTNKRITGCYILFGALAAHMYLKFSEAIENLNIRCNNF